MRIMGQDVICSKTPLSASYFNIFLIVVILEKKNMQGSLVGENFRDCMKKQPSDVYYKIRYSEEFLKIHRNTLRPATLLKKRL